MSRINRKFFVYCNVFHTAWYSHCFLKGDAVKFKVVISQWQSRGFWTTEPCWSVMWQAQSQTRGLKTTTPCSGENKNTTKANTCEVCQRISPTASGKWGSNCKINRNRSILGVFAQALKLGFSGHFKCRAVKALQEKKKHKRTFCVCIRLVNSAGSVPKKRGADYASLYVVGC